MIKFRMYSKVTTDNLRQLGSKLYRNAKKQAIENPLTTGSLGLVAANSGLNLYNTVSSKAARKRQVRELEDLKRDKKGKIIFI